jgi:hypothetical protein
MRISSFIMGVGSVLAGVQTLHNELKRGPGLAESPGLSRSAPTKAKGQRYAATYKNVRTVSDRAKWIKQQIAKGRKNPDVRAFATKAVSRKCGDKFCLPERDYWGEVKAVFDAIRKNVRYVRDGYKLDVYQAANRTLEFAGGDCDDFVITLGSALQSIGYPIKLRVIQTVDSPDFNHIFLLVGLPPRGPTKWVSLDASVDKPAGWHPPRQMIAKIKDFDVN